MKKRINELLMGTIKYQQEEPEISLKQIEGTVSENEIFRGRFTVVAPEGTSMQGILYSTNARVGFKPATISGYHEQFVFEADTTGLVCGDWIRGEFILNTSLGEYRIPYNIEVCGYAAETASFQMSPEEFAQQAMHDFGESYVTFMSVPFQKNLENWGSKSRNLYRGLRETENTYLCLEQFLVGMNLKEPVRLSLEKERFCLCDIKETVKEELILMKENWGFAKIRIFSDSDAVLIENPLITTEEFVGSRCPVPFLIRKEKLHEGRNFVKIQIAYGYETLVAEVEIQIEKEQSLKTERHQQRAEELQMMSTYLSYRKEQIGHEEWIRSTLEGLDRYSAVGGDHIFFSLYELYLYILLDEKEKIDELQNRISERKNELKDPSWYGIYLCLTAKQNTNANYQELVKDHIQTLYLENQENWILQILMFYSNPQAIRNDSEKLELLRRQYQCGCNSVILFLESYEILKREPLMLRSLGQFEIRLMQFLCKENLLDREICGQAAQIACRMQEFHPVLFRVLCRCFELYPSKKMLTAICSMLICGRKRTAKYAKWYELGIRQDVRLTGLYEYYVESMDYRNEELLPQSVRMYFIYHNTLDYLKKAQIYANIICNRQNDPENYEKYYSAMERFAEEQIELGRINDDLAVLYKNLLNEELLTPAMAEGLERVLFTYEISTVSEAIQEVIVLHEEYEGEQRISVADGAGTVQLFSPEAVILAEDREGNRYAGKDVLHVRRILHSQQLEQACRRRVKKPVSLLLHECCRSGDEIRITPENVNSFIHVLEIPNLKKNYAQTVRSALIAYFTQHEEEKDLPVFMLMEENNSPIPDQFANWISILAREGRYEQIYQLISVYGYDKVALPLLMKLCHYYITELEYEEDKMLLSVCCYCFEQHMYDEAMIRYLMHYYEGPVETMKKLWDTGTGYGLECMELEERILLMLFLTEQHLENTEEIFRNYAQRPGKSAFCIAYVVLMSYEYFVREKNIDRYVFEYIENYLYGSKNTPDVCRLALMRYYAGNSELDEKGQKRLCRMIDYYHERGMSFAFLKKLPEELQERLHLQDRYLIEFRTVPGNDVILHYSLNGSKEETTLLNEVFEGIYVREFTVFYGDTLEWYFEYREQGEKKKTDKEKMVYKKQSAKAGVSRYELINRMMEAKATHNDREFQKVRDQYIEQQHLVDVLFPIS